MHEYWDKQPMSGIFEERGEVRDKPLDLPDDFVWSHFDTETICEFINKYYIRDDTFKLSYDTDFIKWYLESPTHHSICISEKETGQIVGHISSVPVTMRVSGDIVKMVQINFLCVHPKYRSHGFAPLLISEIKRIANTEDIWQAVFTAVTTLPTPITKANYWHRFLNVKNLVKSGFHKTNRVREKYYDLKITNSPFRKMAVRDIPKVTKILKNHFDTFKIAPVINKEWVKRWILPLHSYVNDDSDEFISFYSIPYERTDGTHTVKQAYGHYIVGDVYQDAFTIAKNMGFDVFNILDVGEETSKLEDLKFMKGTGTVNYYLFNWYLSESVNAKDIMFKLP